MAGKLLYLLSCFLIYFTHLHTCSLLNKNKLRLSGLHFGFFFHSVRKKWKISQQNLLNVLWFCPCKAGSVGMWGGVSSHRGCDVQQVPTLEQGDSGLLSRTQLLQKLQLLCCSDAELRLAQGSVCICSVSTEMFLAELPGIPPATLFGLGHLVVVWLCFIFE